MSGRGASGGVEAELRRRARRGRSRCVDATARWCAAKNAHLVRVPPATQVSGRLKSERR